MDKTVTKIRPGTRVQLLGLQDALVRQYLDMHRVEGRDYTETLECLVLALADARRRLARTAIEALARRSPRRTDPEREDDQPPEIGASQVKEI
jgi:hypothetical protein